MAHMTNIIPNVNIPVVMAGGFGDGRGIAAALLMGTGVQVGSRFLASKVNHQDTQMLSKE